MPKKIISGMNTLERIEEEWMRIITLKERPTVKEFCGKIKISVSSLYHNYPDQALKVRQWRDGEFQNPRKLSPITRKKEKVSQAEALILIDRLRKELISEKVKLKSIEAQCNRFEKETVKLKQESRHNEILRSMIQQVYDKLKKHLSSDKAQKIIEDIENFEERNLKVVR